ncbi:MAG: AAA family ATPase, partial [Sulfuriferula multivorans]|nr:AAA family ATPase [Sulfuriferula multivorans]
MDPDLKPLLPRIERLLDRLDSVSSPTPLSWETTRAARWSAQAGGL